MGIRNVAALGASRCGGHRLLLAVLVGLVAAQTARGQPAAGIDFLIEFCGALVRPWGYPCNEYTVETADGYLLGVQNIPNGIVNDLPSRTPRTPVFLLHGIFAGGDDWVYNGPSESLGFILADAGYDVWIGNIRGVVWSHGHVSLSTNGAEFWDWTWDELAAYDLPAMLGFVYNQRGSKVTFIGHSQGTTMLMAGLVGTSQSQSLTQMLGGVVLICPIASIKNSSSSDLNFANLLIGIYNVIGIREIDFNSRFGGELAQEVCGTLGINCTDLYRTITSAECCLNYTREPFYLSLFQPTSSKNIAHFEQRIIGNTFSKYDYGPGNYQIYKQLTPPVYNVENFPETLPLMIVYGGQDTVAKPSDVQYLVTLLGSKITKILFVERYGHTDFLGSTTANVDIYPEIISFAQNPSA